MGRAASRARCGRTCRAADPGPLRIASALLAAGMGLAGPAQAEDAWSVAIGQGLVQYTALSDDGAPIRVVCDVASGLTGSEAVLEIGDQVRDLATAAGWFHDGAAVPGTLVEGATLDGRETGAQSSDPATFAVLLDRLAAWDRVEFVFNDGLAAATDIAGPEDGFASCDPE